MKKVLMALLDKRRALKTEADAINVAIEKAEGTITAEQTARLTALHGAGDTVAAELEALAASLPDDPQQATAEAIAAAVAATREADANIAALCHLANQFGKAAAFIKEGKAADDVRNALQAGKVEGSGREISNRGGANGGSDPAQLAADWSDVADKVNAQFGFKKRA